MVEYINIDACKHFYGTCLDFSGAPINHCYDAQTFELEKICTFVTSPTQNLVWGIMVKWLQSPNLSDSSARS